MRRARRELAVLMILVVLFGGVLLGPRPGRADGLAGGGAPGEGVAGDGRHWAQDSVRFVQETGLLPSRPPGGGDWECDVAVSPELWNWMVCRLFGAVPGDDRVPGSLRYWLWCYTGAFGGEQGIARAHAFGAFMKILGMYGRESLSLAGPLRHAARFADWMEVPSSQDALVDLAVERGLVVGLPDGTLRPRQHLTVGEAATFLHRAVEKFGLIGRVPVPSLPVNLAENKAGDVRLILYTDKTTYRRGETVGVVAGVENLSSRVLAFTRWNIGDPAIYVRVKPVEPGWPVPRLTLEEEGFPPIRLPAVNTGTLAVGASITQCIAWRTVFPPSPSACPPEGPASPAGTPEGPVEPLPPGTYRITASFFLQPSSASGTEDTSTTAGAGAQAGLQPSEITASVDFVIAGEDAILVNADQARDLALRHREVERWWDAHCSRNLVKDEDGQWYVKTTEGWQKATAEYALAVANQVPDVQVTFVRGLWEIVMLCKMGDSPHRMVVHVDPYTGEIVDRQADDR